MVRNHTTIVILLLMFLYAGTVRSQNSALEEKAEKAMLSATRYMVEEVSTHGGYLRLYRADFSRRWAELEAFDTQIQLTYGLTPRMGHLFLEAYQATGNEYYYRAAVRVGEALIWGQHESGGWDYFIDFAGDRSLKRWYQTIGENAWGWNEYNHYYGTPTFKNGPTTTSARFLLRLYLEKMDPAFKPAIDRAIEFFLESQYPLGAWPQRYPQKINRQFTFAGKSDYTSFYILNDAITWNNIEFLIQCYVTLGEERLLDPIRRGMNFYLLAQQGNPQGGWAQQYNMNLEPAHGRPYEPAALLPGTTRRVVRLLMRFYRYTGDRRFLARIPDAIEWLESARLPNEMTDGGRYTHPTFVEPGTNRPLFPHRRGTGVNDGVYWVDYNDEPPLRHYGGKTSIDVDQLRQEFREIRALTPEKATKNSPLKVQRYHGEHTPQQDMEWDAGFTGEVPEPSQIQKIISALDKKGRWLTTGEWISRPYTVNEKGEESNTALLSTEEGASIRDKSDRLYISTGEYMRNMSLLINYID